jgi:hypothetical protein
MQGFLLWLNSAAASTVLLAASLIVQRLIDLWARAKKTAGDFSETPLTNFFSPTREDSWTGR